VYQLLAKMCLLSAHLVISYIGRNQELGAHLTLRWGFICPITFGTYGTYISFKRGGTC